MNKRPTLAVEKRTVVGKKVKKLRKEGLLPGNIYGKDIASLAVSVKKEEFDKVYKEAGETGLVDLKVDSEVRPVLIHNVQLDYLTQAPLHADFYQVNLKEKVKTMVPIVVIGEPKAVADKVGILLQPLSEIEVEALPEALPENIDVNVEHLAAVDEQIIVGDLKVATGVTVLTDPAQVIAKIEELVSKEAQEQAKAEAAAQEAAKVASDATKVVPEVEKTEALAKALPQEEAKTKTPKQEESKMEPKVASDTTKAKEK